MPKYMAGVNAFLAWGRSITHQATTPSRSKRSPAAPSSSDTRSSFVRRLRGDTTGRRAIVAEGQWMRFRTARSESRDQLVEVGLHRLRQVDPLGIGEPLVLDAHDGGDDLEGDLVDVHVLADPPSCLLVVEQARTNCRAVS